MELHGIGGGLILSIVNFLMVFLVLGGLAGILIGLKRVSHYLEARQRLKTGPAGRIDASRAAAPTTAQNRHHTYHLAAMTAALHEFTGQPAGALRIESIEPVAQTPGVSNRTLAVITAALHHYLDTPSGSFTATATLPSQRGVQPVGAINNTWKIAGRLEALGYTQP